MALAKIQFVIFLLLSVNKKKLLCIISLPYSFFLLFFFFFFIIILLNYLSLVVLSYSFFSFISIGVRLLACVNRARDWQEGHGQLLLIIVNIILNKFSSRG